MEQKINPLITPLQNTVESLTMGFETIPESRRHLLGMLTAFVQQQVLENNPVYLNFICTHNSRRSHIAQLWAQAAAHYYGIPDVHCYSGGTDATAFNVRAVRAMTDAGFVIQQIMAGENPRYAVSFAKGINPVIAFSKRYDDAFNPDKDFAAVMTCSEADQNCPLVPGASARIALAYRDPKESDDTLQEVATYKDRVKEIGAEILYAFSFVQNA